MLLIPILAFPLIVPLTTAFLLSTSLSTTPTFPNIASSLNIRGSSNTTTKPTSTGIDDAFILNYILTLSYLLRALYSTALTSLTHTDFLTAGFPDPFYASLKRIYFEEESHVRFLNAVLEAAGWKATRELEYLFPYGEGDVVGFVRLAGVVEGVGVSA